MPILKDKDKTGIDLNAIVFIFNAIIILKFLSLYLEDYNSINC